MTDPIEIGVEVRTNSVRSATKEVDSLGKTLKSAERSASAFVDAFARQERQVSKAAIANKAYSSTAQKMYNEILKIDTATKSASASASVFAANLEKEARAAAQVAKENERLKNKFVEGHTAMNIYTKELNDLAIARKRDIITSEQQKDAVAQLNAQMKAGTGVFANAATGMQIVGKRANRSGVLMQQAGYQFGDFAVQVQSGTNYMVAFGQQATQLIGTFSMLAKTTGMIALFSGLGVVVPILTAIGAYFIRAKESADSANGSFEDVKQTLQELSDIDEGLGIGSDMVSNADVAITKFTSILTIMRNIQAVRLSEQLAEPLDALREEFREFSKEVQYAAISQTEAPAFKILGFEDQSQAIQAFQLLADIQGKTKEELQDSVVQQTLFLQGSGLLTEEVKKILATYGDVVGVVGEAAKTQEQLNDSQEKSYKRFDAHTQAYQKHLDNIEAAEASAEESIRLEQQKLSLMLIEKDVGKDTGEYARTAARYERENLYLKLKQAGVSDEIIVRATDLLWAQQQVTAEMIASADQAERLKNNLEIASSFRVGGDLGEFANVAGGIDAFGGAGSFKYGGSQKFDGLSEYEKGLRKVTKATEDADKAAEALRKELEAPMVKAIDSVSNAFGDFIADGLRDFKSFASSIVSSFKSMISQMIATAARNKIMLSMGMGGTAFAEQAAAGNVAGVGGNAAFGPIGSFMGSFAGGGAAGSGLLGGMGSVFGSTGIGLGGSFGSLGTLLSGGSTVAAGGAGFAATLGAAIPAIAAVAVVIGLFTKKTKLLDSGLRTTVEGFDVAIETFKTTQTSRLFGLLKGSKKTAYEAASAEVADPLIEAIGDMQQSVVDAAGTLGIGSNAFKDFSYQFKLSLKGLTEEQQLEKINEEITKMGDSFASLTGHFETMNELLEAATQRMQLQNRLDQLLGNNQAILTRQREAELKAMHELNRPLAQAIYDLEDAQAAVSQANQVVANSFAALRASIDAEKGRLQDSFASVLDGLKERLDVVNEALDQSRNIYDMLANALSSRKVSGEAAFAGRRSSALSFLRGGDFSDERRLENALDVVSEPSEGLFSSFVDYARDFGRTSIIIDEAKKVAQVQLTAGEKQVLLLEEQIVASEANRDAQLEALDQQFQMMVEQHNALLGIDTSVKSVGEAIGTLQSAIGSLASAQSAAKAAAAAASPAGGGSVAEQFGTGEKYQGFNLVKLRGASELMQAAASAGVQTSGQSGAQISKAIANATGLAVSTDSDTRAKQFAMGGYHTGGMRMVGERGPELEATGPSRIFSHNQTSGMFRDPDLKEAVNELRREVSGLRSEQRQMQATNAKYVKRNYDINRKWDVDGLPATRT